MQVIGAGIGIALRSAFDQERLGRNQFVVPAITQLGGTALTVTVDLYDKMVEANTAAMAAPRPTTGDALRDYITQLWGWWAPPFGNKKWKFLLWARCNLAVYA